MQISESVKPGKPMFLYAMQSAALVKIGYSNNPEKRALSISSASPYPVKLLAFARIDGRQASVAEHEAHTLLHKSRERGEWFALDRWTAATVIEYAANGDHGWKIARAVADLAGLHPSDIHERRLLQRFLTDARWRYLAHAAWTPKPQEPPQVRRSPMMRKLWRKRAEAEELMAAEAERHAMRAALRREIEALKG